MARVGLSGIAGGWSRRINPLVDRRTSCGLVPRVAAREAAAATKPVNVRHGYAVMVLRCSARVGLTAMASGESAVRNCT